jgi:hypothetical protein
VSTLLNQARQDLVDEFYSELANLADELVDGIITLYTYNYRNRQITSDIIINEITPEELVSARERRYPNAK